MLLPIDTPSKQNQKSGPPRLMTAHRRGKQARWCLWGPSRLAARKTHQELLDRKQWHIPSECLHERMYDKNIVCLQYQAVESETLRMGDAGIHCCTSTWLLRPVLVYCCHINIFVISEDRNSLGQFQSIKLITAALSKTEHRHSNPRRSNFLHIGKQACCGLHTDTYACSF